MVALTVRATAKKALAAWNNWCMSDPLITAQIGCGYWGPNLLRNLVALPGAKVKYVAEASPQRG